MRNPPGILALKWQISPPIATGMPCFSLIGTLWSLALLCVSRLILEAVGGRISLYCGAVAEDPEEGALEFSPVRGCGALARVSSPDGDLPSGLFLNRDRLRLMKRHGDGPRLVGPLGGTYAKKFQLKLRIIIENLS